MSDPEDSSNNVTQDPNHDPNRRRPPTVDLTDHTGYGRFNNQASYSARLSFPTLPLDSLPPDPFFLDAFRTPTPSPPRGFLDRVLNPLGLNHNRYSPFRYTDSDYNPAPATTRPPVQPSEREVRRFPDNMAPHSNASSSRPARLPSGYVDLTAPADSPPRRRKRESTEPGPSLKRQRREDGAAGSRGSPVSLDIEQVDLTVDKPTIREILEKQREDAIRAQTKPEEKATTFNNFNCVICMDTPTDLTATACGHLFCHTCLMEALIAGENRSGPGEQKRSQCPVCRKAISRNKASDIIPLALKKGLATQPRRKAGTSATT